MGTVVGCGTGVDRYLRGFSLGIKLERIADQILEELHHLSRIGLNGGEFIHLYGGVRLCPSNR